MKKETIYLAGGCFWGTEKYMEMVPGVLSTRVGYALGKQKGVEQKVWDTVTYEEVCNHSGHAETVEVVFDADETTLTNILQDYFYTIDPTSLGRQGADFGIQYRTGIYSLTEDQQKVAAEALEQNFRPSTTALWWWKTCLCCNLFPQRNTIRNISPKIPAATAISILPKSKRKRLAASILRTTKS